MKKIVLSLAILGSISLSTFAGTVKDKHQGCDRKFPMKELNLSAEQQEKMKSLREDYKTKQRELADNHRKEVQQVLTPEQQSKMKELRESRKKDKHSGRKDFSNKGRRGHKDMKLDDKTIAKLDVLKENFVKEKKAVELSRIAPEAQKQRVVQLKDKYRTDRRAIIKEARQVSQSNKTA